MAAYAAVISIKRIFSIIIHNYDVLLPPLVLETYKFAVKELKSFQNFVEKLDSRSRKRMDASLARIAEEILKFEEYYISVDLFLGDEEAVDFSREVHSLVEKMKKVEEYYMLLEYEDEVVLSSSRVVSKSKMVGLRDDRRLLKDDVINPRLGNIVSLVVGMAGIGKTTFVREIFEDLDILELFDCRAWVSVGKEWRPEEIGEAILAQVDHEADKMIRGGCMEEIGKRLKESLKGKRYLIVLDDVWHKNVYEYFLSSIFDDQNGSHILVTGRMKLVGLDSTSGHLFLMRLLDKEESWDVLREKVFPGGNCPPHLEKVGKKIAEKCDGLPLTIVTVADLLLRVEESLWIDVATKKKHQLFIDAYDQISQVLYPSYEILCDELKLCFLYMGAFPQKYEIPKLRLIHLWIAEGFVEPRLDQTLESCAEECLWFLELNGIVMVYQRGSASYSKSFFNVQVKTCGLHSSWWHFCQIEAKKENCFHVLDCYKEEELEEAIEGHSRLSIHSNVLFAIKHVHNSIEEICASTARTLLCLGPYNQYMVPVCFGLKLLLRLDALNIRFYDFPLEVLKLVKLRYLALTCNGNLPPSISNLRKLQCLIVHPHLSIKSLGALSSYMPIEIWDLEELKHLEVMGCDLPCLGDASLPKLITLSDVTTSSCNVLNRVPNLTTLGIRIEVEPDVLEPLSCFDHISHLTKLESLKCVIINPGWKLEVVSPVTPFPCLPFSLTNLSLNGLGYPWEEMKKIASLPNLQVLKLRFNAFQGTEWEVEENEFPSLSSLLIEDIDLVKLKWAHGSFKILKVLKLKHCYKFKELDLRDLPHIAEIEVVDCSPWVEWFIKYNTLKELRIPDLFVRSSWKS